MRQQIANCDLRRVFVAQVEPVQVAATTGSSSPALAGVAQLQMPVAVKVLVMLAMRKRVSSVTGVLAAFQVGQAIALAPEQLAFA